MVKDLKYSFIYKSFIFTTMLVFLSEWIQESGMISFPLGFRHLMIISLVVVNWLWFGKKIVLQKNYRIAINFLILFLIIAGFFSKSSFFNYLLGVFFTFLFVFVFVVTSNTKNSRNSIIKIFKYLLICFAIMSIISIFQSLSSGSSLREYTGLFRELGAFGAVMNFCTMISLSLYIITSKKIYFYLSIFFSVGVALTILKKTIISNVLVWLFYFFYRADSKIKIKLFIVFLTIFLAGFFLIGDKLSKDIEENTNYLNDVGSKEHVRIGMFLASKQIALDYFPFGSGLGTFGSLASISGGYSQVHFDYGVAYIGTNSPEDVANGKHTLLDTYWPHIFAELGFVGTFLFLVIWLFPLKKAFFNIKTTNEPFVKGISFYIIMSVITTTWEGFTLYTPEIPSFVLLHSGLVGLCYYHFNFQKNVYRNSL